MSKTAILLLAHGTPDTLDDIPEYLGKVTGGRPMPQHVIDEIRHRYSLIGKSPLTALTLEQGEQLAARIELPVYVGMRNWRPYIADVVAQMRADGVTHAVAICLAPQNSRTSVGLYRRALLAAAGESIAIEFIEGWADHPQLIDAFADRLRPALAALRSALQPGEEVAVLFTAHSVPSRTVETQPATETTPAIPADPYPEEAKRTAALVAAQAGLAEWSFAFQSQGVSGGPWIGPTVEDTLTALHAKGAKAVLVQPIGFLCDHVEILYDIDIAFRDFAAGLGLLLERPASLNDSPLLIEALADLAFQGLERLATPAAAQR